MPSASAVSRRRWMARTSGAAIPRWSALATAARGFAEDRGQGGDRYRRPTYDFEVRSSTSISSPLRAPWSCPASSRREPSFTPGRRLRNISCAPFTHASLGCHQEPLEHCLQPGRVVRRLGRGARSGIDDAATGSTSPARSGSPSSSCGVVGFKPPYGRVPESPPFNLDHYCHEGPLRENSCGLRAPWRTSGLAGPHPGTSRRCARSSGSHGSWVRSRGADGRFGDARRQRGRRGRGEGCAAGGHLRMRVRSSSRWSCPGGARS